jgi:RNA polymerase sigma-70 factor (sigma-E family)
MKLPLPAGTSAPSANEPGPSTSSGESSAAVTALYREHALGLIRLAYITLGNRAAAEDIVQEAFCGLYRRWDRLSDTGKALPYLRSSVLNGCRNAYRQARRPAHVMHLPPDESAEAAVLIGERRHEVISALRRLPGRQRQALALRFYLDLSDPEIAAVMGISVNTVRSTLRRGVRALGISLRETS